MAKALVNSSGKVLLRDGKVATSDSVDCCCTTTGACCHDDESCEILSEAACNATVDGVYQGDNTVCDPNPCVTGECGCNRTVAVSVTSVVSITREGDDYMSMTTSFSHTFASADNEGSCFFDWTDFNSCIDGCSNDGRYPDPDAPVYAGEAIFIRRHCEHFPPDDPYVAVQIDVCNTCTQPVDPCDEGTPFCASSNIGGAFDYDPVSDGVNVFNEHFDDDFTTDFHYVESRDTTTTITVS